MVLRAWGCGLRGFTAGLYSSLLLPIATEVLSDIGGYSVDRMQEL